MKFEKEYDIIVVGAGIAGVAAAVQAAREGKRTALIEKTILPGGLATTGLVYIYLPICDGFGHQVSFGLTEELLRLSLRYGPGDIPSWENGKNAPEAGRFRVTFSPAAYMLAMDEFLQENHVDIWYDTLVTDVECTPDRLSAIIVENESGRGKLIAKQFVDASGSALLARRAGLPCFDEVNFLSVWAIEHERGTPNDPFLGNDIHVHATGVPWDESKCPPGTTFRGLSGKTVTDFILKSRKMLLDSQARRAAQKKLSRNDLYALKLPAMPQFRKLYALDAAYTLDSDENNRPFDDSIGMVPDWRKSGPVWEVPYRSLYPKNRFGGLLAAGRCMGAIHDAWEVFRVIPCAGLTGQVAGLAASMAIDAGIEPCDVDVPALQAKLRSLGFQLHLPEIGLKYN